MKKWNQKVKFHSMNIVQYICYAFTYIILIIDLGSLTQQALFATLLLPLVICGVDKLFRKERIIPLRGNYNILWLCLSIAGMIVMFVTAYSVRVQSLSWDWGGMQV